MPRNSKNPPVFFANFPEFSTILRFFFRATCKISTKKILFSPTQTRFFRRPSQGCRCNRPGQRHPCEGPPPPRFNSATTKVAAVSINFPTSTFYFLLYLTPSTSYLLPSTSYSTFLLQHLTYYLLHYPSINKPGGRSGGGRHFL